MSARARQASGTENSRVIVMPAFERYGDQIREWLSALSEEKVSIRSVAGIVRSMRRSLAEVERVRDSQRHDNLANFLRHGSTALENAELDGARYILMTALALAEARFRDDPQAANVRQFPAGVVKLPVEVATGIVAG